MQKGNKKMYNLIIWIEHYSQRQIKIKQYDNMKNNHDSIYVKHKKLNQHRQKT